MTLNTWFALITMFIHRRMRGFSMLWRIRDYAEVECLWTHSFNQWLWVLGLLYSAYSFSGEWEDLACYGEWRSTLKSNAHRHTRLINDFEYLVCFIYHVHSLANERIQHVMANERLRLSRMVKDTLVWSMTLRTCTCFILHINSLANERLQPVMENEGLRRSRMLMDTLV